MSTDSESTAIEQAFLKAAADNGLDTSDTERMADLRRRVALMRQGWSVYMKSTSPEPNLRRCSCLPVGNHPAGRFHNEVAYA